VNGKALSGLLAILVLLASLAAGASAAPGPTDLAVTKHDSADPVIEKATFTYSITVQNLGAGGAADATGVMVTDNLPGQVEFVSASSPNGTCVRAGTIVTCDLGTVNAGAAASVSIVVKAKKSGTLSNTASVTTTVVDTNAANDQDTETTRVDKAVKPPKGKKGKPSCATPTITGTAGNDTLTGTRRADVIVGLAGDDQVFAGDGKDLVCTASGADLVSGGPKDDVVIGGAGRDRLFGNTGKDLLKGKGGRDRLRGNADDDVLNGGRRRDSCRGGAGDDVLIRCP
jgi:uncharacterized repeat protein (TIGR01451 family)